MPKIAKSKVMTASEAVNKFVFDGATVGIGGQTTGRVSMALAHEIVRQQKRDLNLVGCSMSLSMDLMVGAELVKRTECGTGNVELYGATMRWRRSIEKGTLEIDDYSHLGMGLRFLAGSLGLPFMPSKSMLGTDILKKKLTDGHKSHQIIENPWNPGEPVVLLPALNPDVSIIHVQKADEMGNVIIDGFSTHEPEMTKASKRTIVSCEELISTDEIRSHPERTTIPYLYVDAIVKQPWGAFPTSCYGYYEHDDKHIRHYQSCAREGGEIYSEYLKKYIYDVPTFNAYLNKATDKNGQKQLHNSMQALL